MSGLLYSFVFKLVVFLVLITIFMNLVPGKNYQKYIRFFTGLMFALYLLVPIVKGLSGDELLESMKESLELEIYSADMETFSEEIQQSEQEQLLLAAENVLEEQVGQMADTYGYQVVKCEGTFDVQADTDEVTLQSVVVTVEKNTEEEQLEQGESVATIVIDKIQVGNSQETQEDTLGEEAQNFRQALCETFLLEEESVTVKER